MRYRGNNKKEIKDDILRKGDYETFQNVHCSCDTNGDRRLRLLPCEAHFDFVLSERNDLIPVWCIFPF